MLAESASATVICKAITERPLSLLRTPLNQHFVQHTNP